MKAIALIRQILATPFYSIATILFLIGSLVAGADISFNWNATRHDR